MTGRGGPGNSSMGVAAGAAEGCSGLVGEADHLSDATGGAGRNLAVLASRAALWTRAAADLAPALPSRWDASVAPLLLIGTWPGGVLGSAEQE